MTAERDAFDLFLSEIIAIHLKKAHISGDKKKDMQLIEDAERIINDLNKNDRDTVKQYVNNLIYRMADEEVCLYTAGIKDGIKLLSWIMSISKADV